VIANILVLSPVTNVNAGVTERQAALEGLTLTETRVYTGNEGNIEIEFAAHPSILYRLLDAKLKNDNSLIGSTDELMNELSILELYTNSLSEVDDDYSLIQTESLELTGFSFTERVDILIDKMDQVKALIPESGINNDDKVQSLIVICDEVIENLDDIYSKFFM
jgi:hypothetical protein